MKQIIIIALALLSVTAYTQTTRKLSAMPAQTSAITGTEKIPSYKTGATKDSIITPNQIETFLKDSATNISDIPFTILQSDTIKMGTWYIVSYPDSVNIQKPIGTWKKRLVP